MIADRLLFLLDGVREVAPGRWVALCPAHDDKHPSLAVEVNADGSRVLVWCHAGCSTFDVLDAAGCDWGVLYPPRPLHPSGPRRASPINAMEALRLINTEAQLIGLCGSNLANGVVLTAADLDRLLVASGRVCYLIDEVLS